MARSASETRDGLVQLTASRMRDMILAKPADMQIGSLPEIAKALGVGMVTVQQAARVLEHEGFLRVRRGNGGGYYGARPDAAAMSRALSSFLLAHDANDTEAIEILTLLDCDLLAAAARCEDEALRARLREHGEEIDHCDTAEQRGAFEDDMHDILYSMVKRPLMELLARTTMRHYSRSSLTPIYAGEEGIMRWKRERQTLIEAILRRDPALAEFEARRRREDILARLAAIKDRLASPAVADTATTI